MAGLLMADEITYWPKGASTTEYPEPKKRGTRVRDNNGNQWERKNTLWHHVAGPDYKPYRLGREPSSLGRWPFYWVLSQHGPLWLL